MEDFYHDFLNYNGDLPLEVKYPEGWNSTEKSEGEKTLALFLFLTHYYIWINEAKDKK